MSCKRFLSSVPAIVGNPIHAANSEQSLGYAHEACSGLQESSLALSVEVNNAHTA